MDPLILPFREHHPKISEDVYVAPGAVVAGDVIIGEGSSVWFNATLRGDVNPIRVGARSNIQECCVCHTTQHKFPLIIGDDVTVGHGAILHGCTLESGSFIGMGTIILDGAVIETGAMVAAGALVSPGKRVKSGELWAGSPAKFMRMLTPEESENIQHSATHYAQLAKLY